MVSLIWRNYVIAKFFWYTWWTLSLYLYMDGITALNISLFRVNHPLLANCRSSTFWGVTQSFFNVHWFPQNRWWTSGDAIFSKTFACVILMNLNLQPISHPWLEHQRCGSTRVLWFLVLFIKNLRVNNRQPLVVYKFMSNESEIDSDHLAFCIAQMTARWTLIISDLASSWFSEGTCTKIISKIGGYDLIYAENVISGSVLVIFRLQVVSSVI